MTRAASLRTRLTLIILLPLLVVAMIAGFWQLRNAQRTATEVFDRSLLSAALAVASDVAISEGDALSARTRDILADTSGGQVFYHVYAPDGVIVAGYATPPVGIPQPNATLAAPSYFDAIYLGREVSGVRLQNRTEIEGFAGTFTTTVWQDVGVRETFVQDLILRTAITITGLISALAFIVWFGVRIGLRPLLDLEDAIAQRSSDELGPIRRAVPVEVSGIVQTLNGLFGQVSASMTAQNDFISNAAHQLRNPIAGVLALAEATRASRTLEESKQRSDDLLTAARETADLSSKLLLLERAKTISPQSSMQTFNLREAMSNWVTTLSSVTPIGVKVIASLEHCPNEITGDEVMLQEAVRNLVKNAIAHGGPKLSRIDVTAYQNGDRVVISVVDDGVGVAHEDLDKIRERFKQGSASSGSGLGVSIVETIAKGHGGLLHLRSDHGGLEALIDFPLRR